MLYTLGTALLVLAALAGGVGDLQAGVLPKNGDARYELVFWESIKDSQRAEDYEAYLEAFPNGRFAPLAKARASYLRKKAAKAAAPAASKPTAPAAPKTALPAAPKPEQPKIEEMDKIYAVATTANLRKGPSPSLPRVATVSRGARVLVTGRVVGGNWYRVETDAGMKGYMFGDLLQEPEAAAPPKQEAEVAKATPAPRPAAPTPASSLKQLTELSDCDDCPEMVSLPPGSFIMGDSNGDPSERPAHKVTIRKPFAIGKYEVTVGQWKACVADGGCRYSPKKAGADDNLPVRNISWSDAQQYINWLRKKTGQPYRLPTEAEWEYAARAGTQSRYWWGDRFVPGKANCKDCGGNDWDHKSPRRVGSHEANPFGLYDLNGSVWEWVSDCWHRSYSGAPKDGSAWSHANCTQRVIRGGSWRNDKSYLHSASRFRYDADVRFLVNGMRVARDL
jgi:formylglycine-generating enzyme required for sulfatase activity